MKAVIDIISHRRKMNPELAAWLDGLKTRGYAVRVKMVSVPIPIFLFARWRGQNEFYWYGDPEFTPGRETTARCLMRQIWHLGKDVLYSAGQVRIINARAWGACAGKGRPKAGACEFLLLRKTRRARLNTLISFIPIPGSSHKRKSQKKWKDI